MQYASSDLRTCRAPRLATRTLSKGRGMRPRHIAPPSRGRHGIAMEVGSLYSRGKVKDPTLPFDFTVRPEPKSAPPRALSVAELDRAIRTSLDASFEHAVWVEGEVTSANHAASGHAYFSLKDEREDASIDCVLYKSNLTAKTRALLVNGTRVRL